MTDVDAELWIPTLNAERTLHGTLAAAHALSPEPGSIHIVDGDSTDRTLDIADAWDVPVIQQQGSGIAAARNTALAECESDYLAMIDADTQPEPGWLGACLDTLERPNVVGASTRIKMSPRTLTERWGAARMPLDGGEAGVLGAAGVLQTDAVRDIGGWDDEKTVGEDVDLRARLEAVGEVRRVEDTHAVHVPHAGIDVLKQLWRWHSPPENKSRLKRLTQICAKTPYYALQDFSNREWALLTVDLAVTPAHLYFELGDMRKSVSRRAGRARTGASAQAD